METIHWVLIVSVPTLFGVVYFFVAKYNNLVQLKNDIDKAWSGLEVSIMQRHGEIGKLIDVWSCARYFAPKGANGVVGQIVCRNKKDIRARLRILIAGCCNVLRNCRHQPQKQRVH